MNRCMNLTYRVLETREYKPSSPLPIPTPGANSFLRKYTRHMGHGFFTKPYNQERGTALPEKIGKKYTPGELLMDEWTS